MQTKESLVAFKALLEENRAWVGVGPPLSAKVVSKPVMIGAVWPVQVKSSTKTSNAETGCVHSSPGLLVRIVENNEINPKLLASTPAPPRFDAIVDPEISIPDCSTETAESRIVTPPTFPLLLETVVD